MNWKTSETPEAVKIVVAGASGAGKTTLIGAVSDIPPVRTEDRMRLVDDDDDPPTAVSIAVPMDFGRTALNAGLTLALFGAPARIDFSFMWDDLLRGAAGAIVLAHPAQVASAYEAVTLLEQHGTPYVVLINDLDGVAIPETARVRQLLDLPETVQIVVCDVRNRASVVGALRELLRYAIHRGEAAASSAVTEGAAR
ncbi:hypothetical protein CLV63_12422 [Murinocardiopsis flavida]|uniref:Signal recognition particle receptor subunit beta n=1 Tax=Murinocardiopsis flavida TaxID=645275 RepID=A0A2P8CY80_9ACTN|nr:ATP/GTP-binding protein [Murinocardiopsis flavida]PSK89918.1 hypothetical protein CLV63_12422 [Murinocardiopsis flavida]